jgi:predicted peptidase
MRLDCFVHCILILAVFAVTGCSTRQSYLDKSSRKHFGTFVGTAAEGTPSRQETCRYVLVLPPDYGRQQHSCPLIMFLHSAGKRPDDLRKVWVPMPPKIPGTQEPFPFVLLLPQCPKNSQGTYKGWSEELLMGLLDHIVSRCSVDEARIYVTGMSMGGSGTWSLASAYPDRFAAIAPICGRTKPSQACRLKDVPVWAFHGANDEVVPLKESQEMVEAVKACGGDAKLTVYPEAGHNAWTPTYKNKELYDWLLSHRKEQKNQ